MKKISTLALALIAMGSLSMPASAQVNFEPVSSIDASGWYQMRQVKSVQNSAVTSESPKYVFSNETKGYSWFGTSDTQKQDATAFIYIDKGAVDYGIQNINGKWGKSKAEATDTRSGMSINVASAEDKTFTVGNYWDDYKTGIMGGFGSSNTARFQFSKVSEETLSKYDVYTVEINGDITTGSVTSNIDANKGTKTVYPGGSFFFTTGTKLEVSNFTAPDVANCNKVISIDTDNKKVSVTYTYQLAALVEQAKEAISHTSAGYPLESSESRTNLQNAIDAANGTGDDQMKFTKLNDALTAYKKDQVVKMPENGKVYVLTNVQLDGTCYHFSYSTGRLAAVKDKAKAAKFVCRVVNGKYVFVNVEDGKYLVVAAMNGSGTNSGKGFISEYNASWADLTVSKNSLYSCFNIGGRRFTDAEKKDPNQQFGNFIINKKDGTFNGIDKDNYNKTDHTTAFRLEEVTYPNTVTFNTVNDVEGVSHLATFSAPFATVVPEGVTAYYVSTADNTKATMKAIEAGKAIPANAGVILTSTTGTEATMIPATTETAADLTGNKLGNSAGAAKTIAADDHAYILSAVDGQTAFYKGKVGTTLGMNKAYLTLNEAGAPEAISMNFGGNVTGINQIVNAEQNNAPVYDLTGRRVVRTVKGGLYIKGGNKFIAR
ncbi:hypothetical protein [Prevotellamassilia timonensis]|uniref:hypothetical protein n=1 Tax=Prevotellamassilia timonensis TaxID=1852370 RepID=UPI00307E7AF9